MTPLVLLLAAAAGFFAGYWLGVGGERVRRKRRIRRLMDSIAD